MIKVEVIQKDIDNGFRNSAWKCPVACAINRTTGKKAAVTYDTIEVMDNGSYTRYRIPQVVIDFIRKFDNKLDVEPFSFVAYTEEESVN